MKKIKLICTLLVCSCFLLLNSCTKSDNLDTELSIGQNLKDLTPPEEQLFSGGYAELLDDLYPDVVVEDGLLSFITINDFLRASMILSKRTDLELINWNTNLGFESLYSEYSDVMDRFEQLEIKRPELPDFLTQDEATRYIVELVDDAFMVKRNFSPRGMANLVNTENLVLIGGNLHYFTDDVHIVVIGRDYQKMKQAIVSGEGNENDGIYYTQQPQDSFSKTQQKFQNCPSPYGIAHRETIGDQRLVLELFMYYVGGPSGPGLVSPEWTVVGNIYNYRKVLFSWQRTWVDVQIDLIQSLELEVNWAPYLSSGQNPPSPGGYQLTTSTGTRICGQWSNVSEASVIVHVVFDNLSYDDANYDWFSSMFINTGRIQGYRTSNQTTPALDITIGCN